MAVSEAVGSSEESVLLRGASKRYCVSPLVGSSISDRKRNTAAVATSSKVGSRQKKREGRGERERERDREKERGRELPNKRERGRKKP